MSHLDLLHVYDATVSDLKGRRDADTVFAVEGDGTVMAKGLSKLVDRGTTFKRAVITTHGKPGVIQFDSKLIYGPNLKTYFGNKNLDKLFPTAARIYFDGCNVAEGKDGQAFLEIVGEIFLRRAGGYVLGMDGYGVFFNQTLSLLTFPFGMIAHGHVFHPLGNLVKVHIAPGGSVFQEPPDIHPNPLFEPDTPHHRGGNVGNKI